MHYVTCNIQLVTSANKLPPTAAVGAEKPLDWLDWLDSSDSSDAAFGLEARSSEFLALGSWLELELGLEAKLELTSASRHLKSQLVLLFSPRHGSCRATGCRMCERLIATLAKRVKRARDSSGRTAERAAERASERPAEPLYGPVRAFGRFTSGQ